MRGKSQKKTQQSKIDDFFSFSLEEEQTEYVCFYCRAKSIFSCVSCKKLICVNHTLFDGAVPYCLDCRRGQGPLRKKG